MGKRMKVTLPGGGTASYQSLRPGEAFREGSRTIYKGGTWDQYHNLGGGGRAGRQQQTVQQTEKASKDYSAELRNIAQSMLDAADPFRAQRQQYADKLSDLYKDPSSITESASYKFRVGQGQKALERSMAAKGMLGSGNLGLELQRYGQEMASTEFDKEVNRLGMLAGAAPGSPAAGAQLASGLLSGAAGEDFNRGGYAAYADALSGAGIGTPTVGTASLGGAITTTSGGTSPLQVAGGNTLGDPFAPLAPPGPSNRLGGATTAPQAASPVSANPQPEVDAARSTSGWTSYSPAGGTAGVAPGTGTFTSSTGGAGTFGGASIAGGGVDQPLSMDFEETGSEGEQFGGTEFSIWGTHF